MPPRVCNALWRAREGRVVEALGAVKARHTDAFLLIGINDITALGKKEQDTDMGSERVVSDVVGGVCTLAAELKGLSESTRVIVIQVPILPMYSPRMREAAENINRGPIQ